jgi:hypothetical protein
MELLSPRRPEMFPLSNKPICAVTVLGFGDNYRRVGISRIEDLARGNRGWGPTSTHVACRACRLGATYGASISDIHKRHTTPQSNPSTVNPFLASDVRTTASELGNPAGLPLSSLLGLVNRFLPPCR